MKKTSRRSSKSRITKERAAKSARAKVVKSAREKTRKLVLVLIGVLVVIWFVWMLASYMAVRGNDSVEYGDQMRAVVWLPVMLQNRCLEAACAVPGPFEPVEDR